MRRGTLKWSLWILRKEELRENAFSRSNITLLCCNFVYRVCRFLLLCFAEACGNFLVGLSLGYSVENM